MNTMTSKDAERLSGEIFKALLDVAERNGLALRSKGGTYDPLAGSFKPRVEFTLKETESGNSQEKITFERYAPMFGLQPDWYGQEFTFNTLRYKVLGIDPKRRKFAVIVEKAGRRCLIAPDMVRAGMLWKEKGL